MLIKFLLHASLHLSGSGVFKNKRGHNWDIIEWGLAALQTEDRGRKQCRG